MLLLYVCLIISLIFALGGCLVWLAARVLKIRRSGWKIFKGTLFSLLIFLPVFVFLISPLIVSYLVVNASTRPQDQASTDSPGSYGNDFSDVEFSNRDGLTLRGWLMEGEEIKPTIILCHGLFRNRREVLERGCALNRQGYSVLLFDFRNHGQSDRKNVSLGFKEQLDVLGAYHFLKKTRTRKGERFVLMGVSMGAVAAIHAASNCWQDLDAIIADSPFQSLQETVSHHANLFLHLPSFPFVNLFVWNLTRINGFKAGDLDTVQALKRIDNSPILLMYGKDDRRMPPTAAGRMFEAIPHRNKKIMFFEGATHGAAYRSHRDLYLKTVLDFLEGGSGSAL